MYESLSIEDLLKLTVHEDAATELSAKFSTAREIADATYEELSKVKGLGQIRAKQLLAAIALGKRLYTTPPNEPYFINSPRDIFNLCEDMSLLDREHFRIINLNTKNMVLAVDTCSIGTLNSSLVHPREVFKAPLRRSSAAIIALHNHPSGDPTPSKEDLEITKRLVDAGKLLGIPLLDHIIIGAQKYVSLKERGIME